MSCPSQIDVTAASPGWKPNPPPLSQERTTREDEVVVASLGCGPLSRPSVSPRRPFRGSIPSLYRRCIQILVKFSRFVGPGFLIAVAYIDPGNYATDIAAGAGFRYSLLFTVLISNLFAILLQSMCIKLGTVTGLNLAKNCRKHLPLWLVLILYVLAEAAIVATDIAEVRVSSILLVVEWVTNPRTEPFDR